MNYKTLWALVLIGGVLISVIFGINFFVSLIISFAISFVILFFFGSQNKEVTQQKKSTRRVITFMVVPYRLQSDIVREFLESHNWEDFDGNNFERNLTVIFNHHNNLGTSNQIAWLTYDDAETLEIILKQEGLLGFGEEKCESYRGERRI